MPSARLPRRITAGYGAAEMGIAAVDFFLQITLLKFAVDVLGVSAAIAGAAIALAVVWDAITDPAMGAFSDHSRSTWGRRRPFILVGGVATAATFVVLFSPPQLAEGSARVGFLFVAYLLLNTALTVISVPHAALGGELATTVRERTLVFGWRFGFANLGLVAAILAPGAISAVIGPIDAGRRASSAAVVIGLLLIVTTVITVAATRGRDRPSTAGALSIRGFGRGLGAAFANRAFRPLLAAFVIGSAGRALNASTALFYYEHRLRLSETDVFLKVLLPFTMVIALSIAGWAWIATRIGRKPAVATGFFLLGVLGAVFYPIFPVGGLAGPIASAFVGGTLVGATFLLDATVADVVDYDEISSREHREGLYFGFWRLGSKMSRALGIALSGVLLDAVGFVEGAAMQSEATARGLALIFGPGVGVFFVLGALVYLCMPLNEETHARIRRILDRRADRVQLREAG